MSRPGRNRVPIDPDLDPADRAEPSASHRRSRAPVSRARPGVLAAIAAGGALGAPARYCVSRLITVTSDGFPWATFWTNVSGSLALGFVLVVLVERFPPSRHLRPFVATGFLGAFTTFSTLAVETDLLVKDGRALLGVGYAVGSVLAGGAAVWAGIRLAGLVPPRGAGG